MAVIRADRASIALIINSTILMVDFFGFFISSPPFIVYIIHLIGVFVKHFLQKKYKNFINNSIAIITTDLLQTQFKKSENADKY